MYTWETRELPILRAIQGLEETMTRAIDFRTLEGSVSLDVDTLQRGLRALHEGGYITGHRLNASAGRFYHLEAVGLTAEARRAIGQWPSTSMDRLVDVLTEMLEATTDPAERSRLERLRDAVIGAGGSVGIEVLKAWALEFLGPRNG